MATSSSILFFLIHGNKGFFFFLLQYSWSPGESPWTEEPGGIESTGRDESDMTGTHTRVLPTPSGPWRRVLPEGGRSRAERAGPAWGWQGSSAGGVGPTGASAGAWSSSGPPLPNWPQAPWWPSPVGKKHSAVRRGPGRSRLWVGSRTWRERVGVVALQAVLVGLWMPELRTPSQDLWPWSLTFGGPSSQCDRPSTRTARLVILAHGAPPPP